MSNPASGKQRLQMRPATASDGLSRTVVRTDVRKWPLLFGVQCCHVPAARHDGGDLRFVEPTSFTYAAAPSEASKSYSGPKSMLLF